MLGISKASFYPCYFQISSQIVIGVNEDAYIFSAILHKELYVGGCFTTLFTQAHYAWKSQQASYFHA